MVHVTDRINELLIKLVLLVLSGAFIGYLLVLDDGDLIIFIIGFVLVAVACFFIKPPENI